MQNRPTDPRLPRYYNDEETFDSIFAIAHPYRGDHHSQDNDSENRGRQQQQTDADYDDDEGHDIVYDSICDIGFARRRDIPPRPPTPPHTHFSMSDSAADRIPVLNVGYSAPSSLLSVSSTELFFFAHCAELLD